MISKEKPQDFNPKFDVSACFCINDGEILLLQRHEQKDYGGLWNLPAGKVDEGETPMEAAIREVYEETGIIISPDQLSPVGSYFSRYPEYDYGFHTFKANVSDKNVVIKEDEAQNHGWFSPKDALLLNLVPDEDYCILEVFEVN